MQAFLPAYIETSLNQTLAQP